MKKITERLPAIVGAMLFCLSIPALGQDVTIDFTGVANSSVQSLGAYAGYYTGSVNGVAANPGFICDDFNNDVYIPESWQATSTQVATLATNSSALSGTLFGNTIGIDGYAAIAYLANLMASTPASGQGDISAAIWYIGALGTGTNSVPSSIATGTISTDSIAWSSLDATAQNYVTSLLGNRSTYGAVDGSTSSAVAELGSASVANLWIYTPIANTQPQGYGLPQEFIADPISVPEGGAPWMYLLLAACASGLAIFLALSVPEGGAAALYLILASVACGAAILLGRRKRLASLRKMAG